VFKYWKKFWPVWLVPPIWLGLVVVVTDPHFQEKHPKIALALVIVMVFGGSVYMIFLKGWLLRRVFSDKSISIATRNILFVIPSALLGILGLILGLCLKSLLD